MSIATQISRLTSIRNSIKAKLVSLGLLQESNGGETPSTKSGTSQSGNVVVGDDLEACKQAINSINETTPYLLSSTGAKNVAGYKYAQVDTTVFEPIGSSGSINPNAQNAYIGASGGISASAPSGSAPVSLGQISPSGNYQGMSAVNLLYDSNVIKAENIRSGVSIFNITGNYQGVSNYIYNYTPIGNNTSTISVPIPNDLMSKNQIVSLNLFSQGSMGTSSGSISLINNVCYPGYNYPLYLQTSKWNDGFPPYEVLTTSYDFSSTNYITISNGNIIINMPVGVFANNRYYYIFIVYSDY